VNLENIRRGQYETLKQEIGEVPSREPDFGPATLTGAGATVIGARQPLIAYNVYLTTDDVAIANKIARAIRHSSGGLHYVKAMGVLVEGLAQVSMNLTNYRRTAMARVVEMIRREAHRYGVAIHHSELVGLVPNQALVDAAVWYMHMDQFDLDQILENQLYEASTTAQESPVKAQDEGFLAALASGDPTPGGGSAAAYAAAMAASLVAMVGRVTVGKKKYADVEAQMWQLIDAAMALQTTTQIAVKQDAAAFESYMKARRLPQDTDQQKSERMQAIQAATINAAEVPLHVAEQALQILELALKAAELGNINAISDAGSAAALAQAALKGAGLNVRINLLGIENEPEPARLLTALKSLENQAAMAEDALRMVLNDRGGLNLA
jgi:glutamate formiminotransferase/formiminotetrahydrofolate cyclodeaminase